MQTIASRRVAAAPAKARTAQTARSVCYRHGHEARQPSGVAPRALLLDAPVHHEHSKELRLRLSTAPLSQDTATHGCNAVMESAEQPRRSVAWPTASALHMAARVYLRSLAAFALSGVLCHAVYGDATGMTVGQPSAIVAARAEPAVAHVRFEVGELPQQTRAPTLAAETETNRH
ncbi:hypothetical protein HYH03_000918 [Edaphochlamys debaryana]|uniref:Uncharacterized protein n=1 Tax=Edaphochlamys debaryana TaxID=47281 RepID=A0A836C5P7_9CHLO|nr:hypothetical protein HYH03_000918 [Edaphochlamys debaryana]|eukprot:KAG2501100.1 hypothetical protein HYH03_000918 [Edaphochlamys debaryana]